jgi:hypothetical protein
MYYICKILWAYTVLVACSIPKALAVEAMLDKDRGGKNEVP